jgi:predicted Ser/Thr protein kinase
MAMNFDSRTMHPGEEPTGMAPLPPEEIAGRFPGFEILECLGRGGMGVVYKARQKSLDRIVAIKILPPEGVGEEAFSERFAREAATLAKLSHPNIVTVHDFGETAGLFYIVMEYVDGVNLRDLLREGKLEAKQALAIVPPICEALQYAHDKGIVHRDIKPENLLLDRDGRVKIADFGIASLVGASGETAGTPPYMAPEQSGGRTDHRADIYALGVVLYEMLTGERPEKDAVAPSRKVQVDVRIDEMVLRALEKEPELRYQTAVEFRTAVETMAPQPAPARPSSAAPATLLKSTEARVAWPATDSAKGASLGVLTSPSVGSVELHSDRLVLRCGAEQRDIPLAALTACGEAIPPAWFSPAGHRYAGVEFTDPASGQRQRLVFQPGAAAFSLPGTTALRAAEWLAAIRSAHQAATGCELPVWPAAWVYRLRGGPRLLPFVLFLILGCLLFLLVLTSVPLGLAEIALLLFTPLFLALCILGGLLAVRAWSLNRRPLVQSSSPPPPLAPASGLAGGAPDGGNEESIRQRIQWPAVAMAVVGGINVAGCVFGLLVALLLTLVPLGIGARLPQVILPPWLGSPIAEEMMGVGRVTVAIMILMAGWMLVWLGAWVFAFVSALRMWHLKNRGWALAAAIIFVAGGLIGLVFANGPTPAFTATWSMIELGVGIWALVSLLQPETQRAFENRKPDATSDEDADSSVRSQVAAPATGLMVASAFNLLLVAAALLLVVLYAGWDHTATSETLSFNPPGMSYTHTTSPPPPRPVWTVLFPFAAAIFVFVPSLLTFISAWRMRRLQGYGMAIVGAILGIITPPGLLIGLIFGIWALVVLSRREMREAFDAHAGREKTGRVLVTAGVIAGIVLLAALGSVVARSGLMRSKATPPFQAASVETAPPIPGTITQKTLSAAVGDEVFLDFESGRISTRNSGGTTPRPEDFGGAGIDLAVKFGADGPSVTFWNCSTHGIGGGGPNGLIDGPALRPDTVEPGWGKSLRQIAMELPVPAADTCSRMESGLPMGVLLRTRNGPVALEITRYSQLSPKARQIDLRYVLLPPLGSVRPPTQSSFDSHPRAELASSMSEDGVTVPSGGFIRQSGTYQLDGGGRLTLTPSSGGRVSFAFTRAEGSGHDTFSIPDFFKQEGWFVYVDSAARVWIFDGVRQLDVVAPDGRYSAGNQGVRALCPATVWDAVPESVRKSYRETQEEKIRQQLPIDAPVPGAKALDPGSPAEAASKDPVFTLRWVAKAEDKDAVALPNATKGRVTHADGRVEEESLRVSKTWLLEPSMLREVGWNLWKGFDKSLFLILKNNADILALQEATGKRIGDNIAVVWRGRVIGMLRVEKALSNGIKIPLSLPDDEASILEKELKTAVQASSR